MKILFISNPNSTHTRRWVNWFHQHGAMVRVIGDVKLEENWPGVSVDDLTDHGGWCSRPVLKYLAWLFYTRRIIRAWQPDILHAHRLTSAGWLGAFSGFHPFVTTSWGSDLYQFPQRGFLAAWLTSWVLQQADLVTADAQDLCRLAAHYGARPAQVHLVNWGVDLELFHPAQDTAALRRRLGWSGDPILYCPRAMHPVYNLDILLEALPAIREVFPKVMLVLRDYNSAEKYRQEIESIINRLKLRDSVKIISRQPWNETVTYYQAADLALSVPSSDSTPVSLLEAMACGLPVIASDLPAIREWIQPGDNGLLVAAGDAAAVAEAVIKLWNDPAARSRFQQTNLALVQARGSQAVEMNRMLALYQGLMK